MMNHTPQTRSNRYRKQAAEEKEMKTEYPNKTKRKPIPMSRKRALTYLAVIALGMFMLGGFLGNKAEGQIIGAPTFRWTPPSQRTDDTPLANSELKDYRILCGSPAAITVLNQGGTNVYLANEADFPPGNYTCTISVRDLGNLRSLESNEASFAIADQPTEPPPEPDPDLPPNPPTNFIVFTPSAELPPLATYGPLSTAMAFASDPIIAARSACWVIDFDVTNPVTGVNQVLVSRDLSGQTLPGHLSINISTTGQLRLRMQAGDSTIPAAGFDSVDPITAGAHSAKACFGTQGLSLELDSVLVGNDPAWQIGLDQNDLPLWLGGTCWASQEPLCNPTSLLGGSVTLRIFAL